MNKVVFTTVRVQNALSKAPAFQARVAEAGKMGILLELFWPRLVARGGTNTKVRMRRERGQPARLHQKEKCTVPTGPVEGAGSEPGSSEQG